MPTAATFGESTYLEFEYENNGISRELFLNEAVSAKAVFRILPHFRNDSFQDSI